MYVGGDAMMGLWCGEEWEGGDCVECAERYETGSEACSECGGRNMIPRLYTHIVLNPFIHLQPQSIVRLKSHRNILVALGTYPLTHPPKHDVTVNKHRRHLFEICFSNLLHLMQLR